MATARLYNPQNDLALAAGLGSYTPPAKAALLAAAGAMLPAWWSRPGDVVVAPRECEAWVRRYGLEVELGPADGVDELDPWGWSADTAGLFARAGAPVALMPTADELRHWRALSHRRTAMVLRSALGVDPGMELTDASELQMALRRYSSGVYIKSPWSCSGRGVFRIDAASPSAVEAVRRIIKAQGCAMVEPAAPPGLDFAALLMSKESRVEFVGWSVFESAASGAYLGNVVASQTELRSLIASRTDIAAAERAVKVCSKALTPLLGTYRGPLGIDMMAGGDGVLVPCIELNLRRTMGFVAMAVHSRLGVRGHLSVLTPADEHGAILLSPPVAPFRIAVVPPR